ncbi:MAG: hypothetical protein ACRD1R_18800 [Acidobacteriota bacterium]
MGCSLAHWKDAVDVQITAVPAGTGQHPTGNVEGDAFGEVIGVFGKAGGSNVFGQLALCSE